MNATITVLPRRRRYPSDTTDAEWEILEALLPPPASTTPTGGPSGGASAPRDRGRDPLPGRQRLQVASPALGLPALEDRLRILRPLGQSRRARAPPRPTAPPDPRR